MLLASVQFVGYSLALEVVSFGLPGAGVLLDLRRRRHARGIPHACRTRRG
jgi:hypothetical protein